MKTPPPRRLPPVPGRASPRGALDDRGNRLDPTMTTSAQTSGQTVSTQDVIDRAEKELSEQAVLEATLIRETTTRHGPKPPSPPLLRESDSRILAPTPSESATLQAGMLASQLQSPPQRPDSDSPDDFWAMSRSVDGRLNASSIESIADAPIELNDMSRSPTPLQFESSDTDKGRSGRDDHVKFERGYKDMPRPLNALTPKGVERQPERYATRSGVTGDPWVSIAEQLSKLQHNVEVLTRHYRSNQSVAPSSEMQEAYLMNRIDYADKRPYVEVTVEILEVSDFDLATGIFHTLFNVMLDWEEPEFVEGVHYYQNQRSKRFEISNVVLEDPQAFNPHIDILNAVDDMKVESSDYSVHRLLSRSSGRISVWLTKEYKFNGSLKCPHPDGTRFPWDMQRLPMQMKVRPMEGQTTLGKDREIRLVEPKLRKMEVLEASIRKGKRQKVDLTTLLRADDFERDPNLNTIEAHKWSMVDRMSIGTDSTVPNFNIGELMVCAFGGSDPSPDQYHVEIVVIRVWTTYIFDFLIQILLVTISLCTAWVPFNDDTTINKLSISMTIVLAIVFFATTKPPAIQDLTYNTLQDTWDVCMLTTTVIVCIENVFVYIQCYGMDRSNYEDWVLGVGSFLSQAACEESSVGASVADSWFVLITLLFVISIFLFMFFESALWRMRFLLNVKDELESCDMTVDDQIGWQTPMWSTSTPDHLREHEIEKSEAAGTMSLGTGAPKPTRVALTLNTAQKALKKAGSGLGFAAKFRANEGQQPLVYCIARHGMPMLYIFPRCWLALAQGTCCTCRCRCRKTESESLLGATTTLGIGRATTIVGGRGSMHVHPLNPDGTETRNEGAEEPPDEKWIEQFMGLRPFFPHDETVRILDCGTGEVGFYEYCWRKPAGMDGATDLLYSDKSFKLKLDTTKTFLEEYVLDERGPRRFAEELQKQYFSGKRDIRSPPTDGMATLNPLATTNMMATTSMMRARTKILFGPTGQNRQRLMQSKQSAFAVQKWCDRVEEILNGLLNNDRAGIVTDLLLFIPSDQDEATYELVATEYLVQHGDLSVTSLQSDSNGAPFAGFDLNQACSRATSSSNRCRGGQKIVSFFEFKNEFLDLTNNEIDEDFLKRIFQTASYDGYDAECQALVKAIRESEPLMRSFIRNRLFNGTLSAGGGSCQITVKPDHEDRGRKYANGNQPPAILRQSSSNQVVRTSEFQSIPVGNKTPLTSDTLGYAMWPRTEPMSETLIIDWRNHIKGVIRGMDLNPKLKGNLRGVYIGISAVFYAAKAAGCAEELLPKATFLERLNDKLRQLLENPPPPQIKKKKTGEEEQTYDHRDFSNLVLVEALVREVLADSAWIVCKRNWRGQPASLDEGADVGDLPEYVATWSLGFYLSQCN